MTDVHNLPDCEGRVTINELGGWRGDGRRAQVTGRDWLHLGDVEFRVNPERLRKFKARNRRKG